MNIQFLGFDYVIGKQTFPSSFPGLGQHFRFRQTGEDPQLSVRRRLHSMSDPHRHKGEASERRQIKAQMFVYLGTNTQEHKGSVNLSNSSTAFAQDCGGFCFALFLWHILILLHWRLHVIHKIRSVDINPTANSNQCDKSNLRKGDPSSNHGLFQGHTTKLCKI